MFDCPVRVESYRNEKYSVLTGDDAWARAGIHQTAKHRNHCNHTSSIHTQGKHGFLGTDVFPASSLGKYLATPQQTFMEIWRVISRPTSWAEQRKLLATMGYGHVIMYNFSGPYLNPGPLSSLQTVDQSCKQCLTMFGMENCLKYNTWTKSSLHLIAY